MNETWNELKNLVVFMMSWYDVTLNPIGQKRTRFADAGALLDSDTAARWSMGRKHIIDSIDKNA